MEPIRVAHIMGKMVRGGVESVVMNYYRNIDRRKVQFDFFADSDSVDPLPYKEEIESLGGRIYIVPPYQQINKYLPALTKLFKENGYKIVHSHLNTLSVFPLYAARRAGVPVRIAHNHSTAAKGETKKNIMKYALRPFAKVNATHYAACSRYAGEWLFGKKSMERGEVTIFNNAIDLDRFRFDPAVRDEVRRELGIENKFVVGHVGRFCFQKNHEFLIDIFAEVHKQNPNSVLLLVGGGELLDEIKQKINDLSLDQSAIILQNRSDVNRLYQAMDVFVFPSRYEGLGIVCVEAQAASVPVIASIAVPKDAEMTNYIKRIDLSKGADYWATETLGCLKLKNRNEIMKTANMRYDIKIQNKKLLEYYELLYKEQ